MARFKEKMYRFMYGRYGSDQLYSFLMIVFIIVWIGEIIAMAIMPEGMAQAIVSVACGIIMALLVIWMIYRSMSRNIAKRRRENEIYLKALRTVKRFMSFNTSRKTKSFNVESAEFVFRDCTKCASALRLQRRVGRHKVKCPRCSHRFNVVVKKYKAPRY